MPKMKRSDYIGKTYNRLTVITDLPKKATCEKTKVLVKCECGTEKELPLSRVINGVIKSCGCLKSEMVIKMNLTHGLSHHPLYGIWSSIKGRCNNPTDENYHLYGYRGVKMCVEWENDFKSFYDWCITMGWRLGMDIDKDKVGDGLLYSPQTCSILTHYENCQYKSNMRMLSLNGKTQCLSKWAKDYGMDRRLIGDRLKLGWTLAKALTTPKALYRKLFIQSEIKHAFGFIN